MWCVGSVKTVAILVVYGFDASCIDYEFHTLSFIGLYGVILK